MSKFNILYDHLRGKKGASMVRQRVQSSFEWISRKKGRIAFAVLAIVLLALCMYFIGDSYDVYCGTLLNGELTQLLIVSRSAAGKMQMYINAQLDKLVSLAADGRIRAEIGAALTGEENRLDALLERQLQSAQVDAELYYLAADGRVLKRASREPGRPPAENLVPPDCPEMQYFRGILTVLNVEGTGYALALNAPVFDENNRFLGSLVSIFPVSVLVRQIQDICVGESYTIALEGMDNTLLYPAPENTPVRRTDKTGSFHTYRLQKEFGKLLYDGIAPGGTENALNLIGFSRMNIGAHHLFVSVMIGYDEVLSSTQSSLQRINALYVYVFLLLLVLLAICLTLYRKQRKVHRESRYLMEMNSALKHANESSRERMQAEKMQAMGVYMSGITHELNNMLTPVVASSEMLLRKHKDDSEIGEDISEIYDSALRVQHLLRQLLQFSRMEHQVSTDGSDLQVADAIRKSLLLLRFSVPKNIRIVSRDLEPGLKITGRWLPLHQCLTNLCKNAVQAMPDGGVITVTARKWVGEAGGKKPAWYAYSGSAEYAEITVSDTGLGMDQDTLKRIFDPFFTTKSDKHNIGLGLSVVSDAVFRSGGHIEVRSEEGKGSCFSLYFPLEAEKKPDDEPAPPDGRKRLCIIAVTENRKILRILQSLSGAYTIHLCPTGEQALSALRKAPGTCLALFTDEHTKDFSGTVLAYRVKSISRNTRTALITLLTQADLREIHLNDIVDVMIDPTCSVKTLRALVHQIIKQAEEETQR